MSIRRKPGDWVWLLSGAGMCGESARLRAEIQDDDGGDNLPCSLCADPQCLEWSTLWTEPDPLADGRRHVLCHVSECQMVDSAGEREEPANG